MQAAQRLRHLLSSSLTCYRILLLLLSFDILDGLKVSSVFSAL